MNPTLRHTLAALSASALLFACASTPKAAPKPDAEAKPAQPSTGAAPEPEVRLGEREGLPEEARLLLQDRMARHADQMVLLMVSVVLLNHDAAASFADEIMAEPQLMRPKEGDSDTLNRMLPKRFFDLQDQLQTHARGLRDAALARDEQRVMQSFHAVVDTCTACHSAYLYDEAAEASEEQPADL
jgi:hypothetical protein